MERLANGPKDRRGASGVYRSPVYVHFLPWRPRSVYLREHSLPISTFSASWHPSFTCHPPHQRSRRSRTNPTGPDVLLAEGEVKGGLFFPLPKVWEPSRQPATRQSGIPPSRNRRLLFFFQACFGSLKKRSSILFQVSDNIGYCDTIKGYTWIVRWQQSKSDLFNFTIESAREKGEIFWLFFCFILACEPPGRRKASSPLVDRLYTGWPRGASHGRFRLT